MDHFLVGWALMASQGHAGTQRPGAVHRRCDGLWCTGTVRHDDGCGILVLARACPAIGPAALQRAACRIKLGRHSLMHVQAARGKAEATTSNDTKVAQFCVSVPVAQAAPRQTHFVDPEAAYDIAWDRDQSGHSRATGPWCAPGAARASRHAIGTASCAAAASTRCTWMCWLRRRLPAPWATAASTGL